MDGRKDYGMEMDSVGARGMPENIYYEAQSMCAVENFQITGLNMHPEITDSLTYIRKTAAIANCEIRLLKKKTAGAIVQACDEALEGRLHEDFIVNPVQSGTGTSLNMNANEVIANRVVEILGGQKDDYFIVSPSDHVNCGQSTSDVIPAVSRMTSLRLLKDLKSEPMCLHRESNHKVEESNHVIKMGCIQMQDAVSIRPRQELETYSMTITRDIRRIDKAMEEMRILNTGGTAIGTGIDAGEAYLRRIVPNLAGVSSMEFVQTFDLIDTTQDLDPFVAVSGVIKARVVTLSKIANGLRLMSSGPKAGFNEISLPIRQSGPSIMSDRVNPVIPEVVNQVALNIIGNDLAITMATEAGQLELNAFEPIILYYIFQFIDTLAYTIRTFVGNRVSGITANEERCHSPAENSIGVTTALSPHIGYEKAADISKKTLRVDTSARGIILQEELLNEEELDHILNPVQMIEPGISGKEPLMRNNIDEKQYGTE